MKRPDYNYHQGKLELLIRDLRDHTADELARVLMRLAMVSDSEVIKEKEFTDRPNTDNWIKVSKLPEKNCTVWVYNGVAVYLANFDLRDKTFSDDFCVDSSVTHWAECEWPKPPKDLNK